MAYQLTKRLQSKLAAMKLITKYEETKLLSNIKDLVQNKSY